MRKQIYILIFLLNSVNVFSQILIKGGLEFTNPNDSLRQIKNVSNADSLPDAMNVTNQVFNRFINSNQITVIDTVIFVTTPFEFPNYTPGMLIYIQMPVFADSVFYPSWIKMNNLSTQKIIKVTQEAIDTTIFKSGKLISLAYDGTQFIVLNTPVYECPGGYKKMTEDYCIQIKRNPLATFWNAQKNCSDQGAHLCYYAEWYYACINNSGLIGMPQNYEWINTTSNHNIHALKIGNLANCDNRDSETTATTGLPMYYRCCFKLR